MTLPCSGLHGRAFSLLVTLVALVWAAVPVSPARAHTDLVGSSPEDGSQVQAPPEIISLHFSDGVGPDLATVVVTVDGGDAVRLDVGAGASERSVAAAVPASVRSSGRWRVDYRVTSLDGHPIQGGIRFDVGRTSSSSAPEQEGSPASDAAVPSPGAPSDPDDAGAVGYAAGATLLLALAVPALLVLFRRTMGSGQRRSSTEGSR